MNPEFAELIALLDKADTIYHLTERYEQGYMDQLSSDEFYRLKVLLEETITNESC